MVTIPDYLGTSGALARKLLADYRAGKTAIDTVEMWIRNWRAANQSELADLVEAAIKEVGG